LLSVDSTSINEYIIDIMEKLFSTNELSAGSIKDDTSDIGSSSRKPLDFDKIKLLKEAVFAKYQISDDKKEEIWNRIKEIGNRKCKECRDKNKKKKERCWLIKSKYYYMI
jgi:hypothetical protein